MKNYLVFLAMLLAAWQGAVAFNSDTLWSRNLGPDQVTASRFTPDGKFVLAAIGKTFYKFDIKTGELISRFRDSCASLIYKYNISLNGNRILSIDNDQQDIYIWDYLNENIIKKVNFHEDDFSGINCAAITNDGKYALISLASKEKGSLAIFNIETYQTEKTIPFPGNINDIAISPDDNHFTIAVLNYLSLSEPFSNLKLLSINNFESIGDIGGMPGIIENLNYSPDGRYLAFARSNFPLTIWDMESRTRLKEYKPDFVTTDNFLFATFSRESKYILFSFYDFSDNPKTFVYDFENDSLVYHYNVWSTEGLEMSIDDNYVLCAADSVINVMKQAWLTTGVENPIGIQANSLNISYDLGILHFELSLASAGSADLSIYNVNGNKIHSFALDYHETGSYNFSRSVRLPTGVYFAVLKFGNQTISKQFEVVR